MARRSINPLQPVLSLPLKAIVALVNPVDKRVYIAYTPNVYAFMYRWLNNARTGALPFTLMQQDLDKLQFAVLEDLTDIKDDLPFSSFLPKWIIREWQQSATWAGWKMYGDTGNKLPYQFKAFWYQEPFFRSGKLLIKVRLRVRKTLLTISTFTTVAEADKFMSKGVRHGLEHIFLKG